METSISVAGRVNAIIADVLDVDENEVVPHALLTGLGADELDVMELIGILEDELDINLETTTGYATVGEIVAACEAACRAERV